MPLPAGMRLGPYEVLSLIGTGGMGEVYRATDTNLKRQVAIKVLPAAVAAEPDRLARFQREAEVLAALNHPNIAHIHGLERSDGTTALVMELVEGPTLADRIAQGPIPIDEALPIARQIAEALEAAHEQNIIHRDLKPANIKVRDDGTVKVLDFGLAKAMEPAGTMSASASMSPTIATPMTQAGVLLGTAAYMSPEQAKGRAADRRSDVWAFGCVLYEMVTGRPAFPGGSVAEVLAAVLSNEPDWSGVEARTPPRLVALVRRCLRKEPRQRLHDIADARLDIEDVLAPSTNATAPLPRAGALWQLAAWALVAIAALAAGAAWYHRTAVMPSDNPLANAHFARFTDFPGDEHDAAISRDGKFVTFVSNNDGRFDVWVGQVGTGRFTNLTSGRYENLTSLISVAGFTPDGSEVWIHETDVTEPLLLIPMLGGPPRVFLSKSPAKRPPMNAAWSPDGSRLVYHTADDGDPLFVADHTGANARQIFIDRAGIHNHFPVWSRDGRWIYFVRGDPNAGEQDIWRVPADGGAPERLTNHHTFVSYPTPIDADRLLYIARDRDGSGPWLWAVNVARRSTQRVSFGLEQYVSVAANADGSRLAATIANPSASLWRVPIRDRVANESDVTGFSVPTVRALAPRFAAGTLFCLSSRGTGDGLWRYDGRSVVEIWKGAEAALFEPPAVSRDAKRVAIVVRQSGSQRLQLLAADGGDLQPIAATLEVRGAADWSPDGQWITIAGRDEKGEGLFKIAVDDGQTARLTSGAAKNPVWSPDGGLIAYEGADVGAYATVAAVRPDGTRVDVPTIQIRRGGERLRFAPGGQSLVYMTGLQRAQNFWSLDLRSMKTRQLTALNDTATMRSFDITADGREIVFDRLRENSHIVLIQLPNQVTR